MDGEWIFALRLSIFIIEVIDHFFDTHRVGRRQTSRLHQVLSHVGIARCVDVDRKGRQRIGARPVEVVLGDGKVGRVPADVLGVI